MYTINTQKVYGCKYTNNKFNSMIQTRHGDLMRNASPALIKAINKLGAKPQVTKPAKDDKKPSKAKGPKIKLMNKKNK